jgi:small-conductance mechanosensitive channel
MDFNLNAVLGFLQSAVRSGSAEMTSPWFYFQLGVVLTGAVIAFAVSALVRSRIDPTSFGMGWPPLLRRFVRVLVGSTSTAVFALLMALARMATVMATSPGRGYLLSVAAKLALAWLIIRIVASGIRNSFIVSAVSLLAWLVAALSIVGQLHPVIKALDSAGVTLSGLRVTPLLLIKLSVLLVIALWLTNIISNFVEGRITRSGDLTPSLQVLLVKMTRVGLLIFAIAVALSAVGIDLSALAIFSGAAGVGIGFGLQKIVANFISGIILLADKSVKPGDLVTIGDSLGRISAMNTRYISVAAGDGREFLIPNEDLITQKVTNWTYTDKNALVKIDFGTSYDADPQLVCQRAVDIASAPKGALKSKTPTCLLTEFTDAGMKFLLTFWVADPDHIGTARHEVLLALWDTLRREGIHAPYPMREILVRGGPLSVETRPEVSR